MQVFDCPVLPFDLSALRNYPDYGVWGGIARYALALKLDVQPKAVRDIDLLRFDPSITPGEKLVLCTKRDRELGMQFAPDDWSRGAKMSVYASPEDAIRKTDLAISEVCIYQGKIFASDRCVDDLSRGLIRAGDNPSNWSPFDGFDGISGRVLLKALRFVAEARDEGIEYRVVKESFPNPRFTRFHWLLEVRKALQHGAVVKRRSRAPELLAEAMLQLPPFSDRGQPPHYTGSALVELLYIIGPKKERDISPWSMEGLPSGLASQLVARVERDYHVG